MDDVNNTGPGAGSEQAARLYVLPVPDGQDIAGMDNPGLLLEQALAVVESQTAADMADNPRPLVRTGNEERATDWLRETIGTGQLSNYFLRGGRLVHCITLGETGYKEPVNGHLDFDQITATSVPNLLAKLSATYRFRKWTEKAQKDIPVLFPRQPAANCVEAPEELPNVRTLKGIVNTPIIRAHDGSILVEPGFDEQTGLLYLPNGISIPEISYTPSIAERQSALSWLAYTFADFPFVSDDDRASYLGSLFVPLLRDLAPPPYKMLAVNAHAAGSGKGYLAEAIRTIHHGPDGGVFRAGLPHAPDEFRKWITSVLDAGGGGVVQLDNIRGGLGGDVLEGLLTSYRYNDRRLGVSENIHSVNDRLWVATGNNIELTGDMARRTVWCNIDPGVENPEARTTFRIQSDHGMSFPAFVAKYRSEIIHALLVMLRAWVVEGRPLGGQESSDSFSTVTRTVRGILAVSGVPGTYDPKQAKKMSQDDLELAQFLHAVVAWRGGERWTAAEMRDAALLGQFDRSVVPMQKGDSLPSPRSLGMWLNHRRQRGADGYQLYEHSQIRKITYWAVATINSA